MGPHCLHTTIGRVGVVVPGGFVGEFAAVVFVVNILHPAINDVGVITVVSVLKHTVF
jgi:hypothetical protein